MKLHLSGLFFSSSLRLAKGILLFILFGNSSAFFLRWPWSYAYPGTTTTAVGAATINYGFLRPAIVVQVPTTPAPTTTTTRPTTTLPNQLFINALLGSSAAVPANYSLLLSLANALANRPVIGGIARPYPPVIGGVATGTQVVGGVAGLPQLPSVVGGVAAPISPIGGIAAGAAGGIVLPNGFPAGGGVVSGGIIPGLLPGILGRSAGQGKGVSTQQSKGKIVFASKKRR